MTQGYKSWSDEMTDVSVPGVNMLENSSTLAVSVPINFSIKLGSVTVNGPTETYFVDMLHIYFKYSTLIFYINTFQMIASVGVVVSMCDYLSRGSGFD